MAEMDRRALLKKAAVVGAVGWTAPLILSTAADAAVGGTAKCQPTSTLSSGQGYKAHNNGACGVGFYISTQGLACPCGGVSRRFIRWSADNILGAAIYASTSATGNGSSGIAYAESTGNPSPEFFLWRTPGTGTAPRDLQVGVYTVTACVFTKCCRVGYANPAWKLQQVIFTFAVPTPCSAVISGAVVVGNPPANVCPGTNVLEVCP